MQNVLNINSLFYFDFYCEHMTINFGKNKFSFNMFFSEWIFSATTANVVSQIVNISVSRFFQEIVFFREKT